MSRVGGHTHSSDPFLCGNYPVTWSTQQHRCSHRNALGVGGFPAALGQKPIARRHALALGAGKTTLSGPGDAKMHRAAGSFEGGGVDAH